MELITLGFEAKYTVAPWLHSAAATAVYQFSPWADALSLPAVGANVPPPHRVLAVEPAGADRWIGIFHAGAGGRVTGAFATPDSDVVAVVVSGAGFWVPVRAPDSFAVMRPGSIQNVLRVPDKPISVFVGVTRLAAYGRDGLLWLTDDLSWDGLEVEDVDASSICGQGWDSPAGRRVAFRVDLATGACEGGAAPHYHRSR